MFYRNTLISLALASAMMVSGINAAFADEKRTPAEKSSRLQKELNLTDEQTKKVEAIIKAQHEKAEAIRKQAAALKEETHKKLKEVFTPEQMKKYDEMVAQKRAKKERKEIKDNKDNKDNNKKGGY